MTMVIPTLLGKTCLPRGLGHPGDLTVVGELTKADAAHPELLVHRARPAAAGAASICTCLELGSPRLLDAQRSLGHQSVLSFSVVSASPSSGASFCSATTGPSAKTSL